MEALEKLVEKVNLDVKAWDKDFYVQILPTGISIEFNIPNQLNKKCSIDELTKNDIEDGLFFIEYIIGLDITDAEIQEA
jgi:pyruvate-formate lyase-activating enzyme